jgi:hypothetical protein
LENREITIAYSLKSNIDEPMNNAMESFSDISVLVVSGLLVRICEYLREIRNELRRVGDVQTSL